MSPHGACRKGVVRFEEQDAAAEEPTPEETEELFAGATAESYLAAWVAQLNAFELEREVAKDSEWQRLWKANLEAANFAAEVNCSRERKKCDRPRKQIAFPGLGKLVEELQASWGFYRIPDVTELVPARPRAIQTRNGALPAR